MTEKVTDMGAAPVEDRKRTQGPSTSSGTSMSGGDARSARAT